ncbi:MAG: AarF/ABC1/UbiB kinase family protein [Blautia sp.]|nr:AarF/ABC1/UbiB kinase family protein [Blautia sp.]
MSEQVNKTEGKKKNRKRTAQILGVFAKHNFYTNGFTPEELRTTLEDLGPTYVKIGQIMSSRTDMLPKSYCRELEKLRSEVKPLDAAVAREVIEQETGKRIEELYKEFRDEPLGSASIAQAHYGVLLDGTRVVTKVLRPGIADLMRDDFVLLNSLAGMVSMTAEGEDETETIDLKGILHELEKVTEEELDFRIDADHTRTFRELCLEDETVCSCPRIIDELSTERILTMTYVDGYSISHRDFVEKDGYDRVEIGKALVNNYLHQVLDAGFFHGDPHQGNIMICSGVPYWIDFGMVGRISEANISSIQNLIFALVQEDVEAMTNAALAMGTVHGKLNKSRLMEDLESISSRYMSATNLNDIDVGKLMTELTDLLNEHHIVVSPEYTMMVRSLVTMEGVLEMFCPELDLFGFLQEKLLARAKESFDVKEQLASSIEALAATAARTVKLPGLATDVLRNLVKGRLKISFELTGYEGPFRVLVEVIINVILSIFACVLFTGSCMICMAHIPPMIDGVPLFALGGFAVSIALAIFSVKNLRKAVSKF